MSDSTSASVSLTTSTSATTITSGSITSESTSTITTSSIITTSLPPSTTIVTPSSISTPLTTSVVAVTSTIIQSPTAADGTQQTSIVVITSTLPAPTVETPTFTPSSSGSSTSASSTPSTLSASGSDSSGSKGLSTGATIAIAVIVPIAAIAAAILFGVWFWKRRKARKSAEEECKNQMAEYNYNPNNDPTLAPVPAAYAEDVSEAPEDNGGYRGWGATSSNRKASTTLGSNNRPAGLAVSDNGSQPGGHHQHSPGTTGQGSEHYSADPMLHGHSEGGDGIGALGGVAATGAAAGAGLARHRSGHNTDIRRGPSNASSAYSNGKAPSDASSDAPGLPGNYYQEEIPYNIYNDAQPQHGPYGDGSYGGTGGQPIIRDVQARRNTRIERAPTMSQTQGGIAQNF